LQFPLIELTKPDQWTQAPHSRVLPDRFVLLGYRNGQQVLLEHGKQLADNVILGPAPLEDDGNPSLDHDADNRIDYGPGLRWLFDFDEAVERGLGFRVKLTDQEANLGYHQLLVLGLKHSADDHDAKLLIEELIDNHHYSAKGFSLVPQGSPTNNTDEGDSRFDSSDWLHDVSYFVENGEPAFAFNDDPAKAADGQRLADALGIDYGPLQYVGNAGAADHAEAVAMNRALYAGTLGYYLDHMLNEVMPDGTIEQMRDLFTNHVTGRGPLPAIRVGNQPYGVLLTSAFPRWNYPKFGRPPFDEFVRRVLDRLQERWSTQMPLLRHIGKSANAREDLINVLGLQPTSADYYHRVGYSYDYLRNLEEFTWRGDYFLDVFKMAVEQMQALAFLHDFGYDEKRANGTPKPVPMILQLIYRHYHSRLDRKNLIDGLPLSEERGLAPNYIDWLIASALDVDKLESQDLGPGVKRPNSLLYMMLHYSLLHETRISIWKLLTHHQITATELRQSRKFMNISAQPDVSHWEVFRAPVNRIVPNESSNDSLLKFVHEDRFRTGAQRDVGQHLAATIDALHTLKDLPTARLERLLAEHVDTLNYRLDAWQSALFERRLALMRTPVTVNVTTTTGPIGATIPVQQRPTGVYLGHYGYLENVRPANNRVKIPDDVLPQELRENKDNLYRARNNGGYVHTPSLNHATAAAILRNGYLTHATPQEREKLTVNMSSERVRRAKYLVDGVRNDQSLEQLLGYLFERGMHDWTTRAVNPVILDQLKPVFRKAFPIKRTKLPRQGFPNEPAEVVEDFSVVNGLALAQHTGNFPSNVTGMPALNNDQVSALRAEKENVGNSLDALRDLFTAETAYQLALGNFDRASAVMQAISGGQMPVEIDVIHSSRGTDLGFTNRVTLQFDPNESANPWPAIDMTARALTETALNHWIGGLFGDPTTVQCKVEALDANGAAFLSGHVTLASLGLQPLDVVYLTRQSANAEGPAELERRVRHRFAAANALADSVVVRITFTDAGGAPRSFAELLPFADAIRQVLGKARPLGAHDFTSPSKDVAQPADDPANTDVLELKGRVKAIRDGFDQLFDGLENDLLAPDANTLRDRLVEIAGTGFPHAFPESSELDPLLAQAASLRERYGELKEAHDEDAGKLATLKPPQQVTTLTTMARRFFGDDFVLIPRFLLLNDADVTLADANRGALLDYAKTTRQIDLPVDEWLHGVAHVRPAMHTFSMLLLLADAFGAPQTCSPIQLPFRAGDTWLGTEFPETTEIVHDTISIVQCLPPGFTATGPQAGLLIDEWMEMLPRRDEVTGIAFNYDQPNSVPPAAVLLAVTPGITGRWTWDDLTAIVRDTFARAKLRAVEPDMVENLLGFASLIPSTLAEFSTGKSTIALDYLLNLEFVSNAVATIAATKVNP
jgi:hypothetical protein